MKRGALAAALLTALTVSAVRGQGPVGYFEGSGDVGAPALAGSTAYDAQSQTYTIVGAGTNMWATRDEFQFVWRKLSGNFIVRNSASGNTTDYAIVAANSVGQILNVSGVDITTTNPWRNFQY